MLFDGYVILRKSMNEKLPIELVYKAEDVILPVFENVIGVPVTLPVAAFA